MLHTIVTDCNLQDFCTEIGQMLTELWDTVSDKHSVRAARHPLAQRYSPSPSSTTSSDPALHSPDTGAASHLLPRLSLQGASWGRTTTLVQAGAGSEPAWSVWGVLWHCNSIQHKAPKYLLYRKKNHFISLLRFEIFLCSCWNSEDCFSAFTVTFVNILFGNPEKEISKINHCVKSMLPLLGVHSASKAEARKSYILLHFLFCFPVKSNPTLH